MIVVLLIVWYCHDCHYMIVFVIYRLQNGHIVILLLSWAMYRTSYRIVLCCAISYHVMIYHIATYCSITYCVSYRIVSYCVSYHIASYRVLSYCSESYCMVSWVTLWLPPLVCMQFTCGVWGSFHWHVRSHHNLAWDKLAPLSWRPSNWRACH